MKNTITLLLLAICVNVSFAQDEDVEQEMLDKTCECVKSIPDSSKYTSSMEMQLGLCIFEAANGRREEIKELYGIDLDDPAGYEEFGEVLGEKLAMQCPAFMDMVLVMMADEDSHVSQAVHEKIEHGSYDTKKFDGKVAKLRSDELLTVKVEGVGYTMEFICLEKFEGVGVVELGKDLIGKEVFVEYKKVEIYDPKSEEFVTRNQIISIRLV